MDENIEKAKTCLLAWEEGMARYAECLVWFQHIEHVLSVCISAFAGTEEKIGEIITAKMSFNIRVETLSALLSFQSSSAGLSEDTIELIMRLRWAETERNRLVHSIWNVSEANPGQLERTKRTIRKNEHRVDEEHYFPADFEELQALFEGICSDLVYVLSNEYPDFSEALHY